MNKENEKEIDVSKEIKDFCIEYSNSMIRTEAERDFRKEAIDLLHEKTNIDKKILAFCAKTYHRQDFDEKSVRQAEMQVFYSNIFGSVLDEDMSEDLDDDI